MTTLIQRNFEDFWIRCYLSPTTDLEDAAIDRAYLDFNRTLHGIGKEQTHDKRNDLKSVMKKIVLELLTMTFKNQNDFDSWHETKCAGLVKAFRDISNHPLHIGQAQKWINMTLKYLFALGENRTKGISRNYEYFHFPIDNIIQEKLVKRGIPRINTPWSRIDNYIEYLDYQNRLREIFVGQIPMDVEFRLFNE